MDLTKTFLSTFTGSSELNLKNNVTSANGKSSGSSFESYLNKAETKTANANKSSNDSKASKTDNKATSSVKDNKNNTNDTKKTSNKTNNKNDDSVNNQKKNTNKEEAKTKATENTQKTDEKEITEDKIKDVNQEIIELISEKTGLSVEEISSVLESLNMQALDLNDSNNLLSFMMKLTGVDSPVDLISVDGVKEIMTEIKDVFAQSEDLTKFSQIIENVAEIEVAEDNLANEATTVVNEDNNTEVVKAETEIKANNQAETEVTEDSSILSNPASEAVTEDVEEKTVKTQKNDTNSDLSLENNVENTNDKVVVEVNEGNTQFNNSQDQNLFSSKNDSEVNVSGVVMDNITKAFNEAMVRTESVKNVDTAEVVKQIIDKVKVGINRDVTELKISLKPEELGDVTVKIASQNGIVTAQITAESQRVKEIIEAGFNQLKQALSDAGVEVSQLEVNVGSSDQNPQFENQGSSNEKSSARINQIIAEAEEDEQVYVKENEVIGSNVNYTA